MAKRKGLTVTGAGPMDLSRGSTGVGPRKPKATPPIQPTPKQTENFEKVFNAGLPASFIDFGPPDKSGKCRIMVIGEERNFYFSIDADVLSRKLKESFSRVLADELKQKK